MAHDPTGVPQTLSTHSSNQSSSTAKEPAICRQCSCSGFGLTGGGR
jgi:hypothetical protein